MANTTTICYESGKLFRTPEQCQYLVEEMCPQIIRMAGARRWFVFPCVFDSSTESVEAIATLEIQPTTFED